MSLGLYVYRGVAGSMDVNGTRNSHWDGGRSSRRPSRLCEDAADELVRSTLASYADDLFGREGERAPGAAAGVDEGKTIADGEDGCGHHIR
jgi:hypothetical protein